MTFKLDRDFISTYKDIKPSFGFDGLGEFVYTRTYSREKEDGRNEVWYETVQRVVEGTYSIQKRHALKIERNWDEEKGQSSAEEMFDRIFHMKFLPPGRGLWAMGTKIIEERGLSMALNNCAFTSTEDMDTDVSMPFRFLMDASMLGVGVGFDTKAAGKQKIHKPIRKKASILKILYRKLRKKENSNPPLFYDIEDTREGWVKSLGILLNSYLTPSHTQVKFGYDLIRAAGEPIKGFGGTASGPGPLRQMHEDIKKLFDNRAGDYITSRDIVDVMNMIGRCVVAGNVRRTAELALGSHDDLEYLDLKNYDKNPERASYGWTSNNSIIAKIGMDYTEAAKRTAINGEPGYFWLENAQKFGRMVDPPNYKDMKVSGANPCVEQSLESGEMCCLVEVFPNAHDSKEDFLKTLKYAYLYGKTVTLVETHWDKTNEIIKRNRRIGTSITDISRFVEKNGLGILHNWLESGYKIVNNWDKIYSKWFNVAESIKKTTVKPSGTVSLLAGATPGVHYPESQYYIRRVRVAKTSPLLHPLNHAGYHIEQDVNDTSSMVVSFIIDAGENIRPLDEVSMWEQLQLAAFMQQWWSDNQVSVTVTFKKEEANSITEALDYFQHRLKSVSFLPKLEGDLVYPQMPYEKITKEQYHQMSANISDLNLGNYTDLGDGVGDKYCENDHCEIIIGE